jgi:predicted nucleic acid-binding Zn ribbon protein
VSGPADRAHRQEARPIGDVLKALLRRKKFLQKGKYAALTQTWAELVGTAIAARTRIRAFQEGRLTIEVTSSVLLHELNGFMKPQLLSGLQAGKGGRDVAELRFCLGNEAGAADKES